MIFILNLENQPKYLFFVEHWVFLVCLLHTLSKIELGFMSESVCNFRGNSIFNTDLSDFFLQRLILRDMSEL